MKRLVLLGAALFGIPALVACGGGGGLSLGMAGGDITLANGETYPVGALSGSGRVLDPFKLPDTHPAGLTAGIKDFLLADNGGYFWKVPVRSDDGFAMGEGPYPFLFFSNGLTFDATGAGWFQLSNTFTNASRPGWRLRGDCMGVGPNICDSFFSNVPPNFSTGGDYGTFEIRTTDDDDSNKNPQIESLAVRAYTWGLPTPSGLMPHSGSAQYKGPFKGIFGHEERTDPLDPATVTRRDFYEADAEIDAQVTFAPSGGAISIGLVNTTGQLTGLDNDINGTFEIAGSGSVSGNTFGGTITVPVTASGQTYNLSGRFDGGFFGPATGGTGAGTMPEEMAGTLSADDGLSAPQDVLVGGFQGDVQ